MSLYTDELANLVEQEVSENGATREDWEAALRQVFDSKYKVGDPDPTPNGNVYCGAETKVVIFGVESTATCTWDDEHPGVPHVAGTGHNILAIW